MKNLLAAIVAGCALFPAGHFAFAQNTAFSYQGQLASGGQPVNGLYDFTFSLFNTNGDIVGGPVTSSAINVTNGFFTTSMDFGAGVFTGSNVWIEISVSTNGANSFVTLNPRQAINPTPWALTANSISGPLPPGSLGGTYSSAVTLTNPSNSFAGDGSNLINLNASALTTGVVPPARMGSLTNHSDVQATGLTAGNVLIYGGAAWTNGSQPILTGGPAASNGIPVSLSYSGTNVAVNASLGTHFRLIVTNNFLLLNPTNASDAQRVVFEFIQDASGGHTMTLGNAFKLGTDLPFVNLTTNANLRDFMTCVASGTNFYVVGFIKGY